MDIERVVSDLQREFPGKSIVCVPKEHPREVIAELGKVAESTSAAVAIIDRGPKHVHRATTETYVVETGQLRLHLQIDLEPGDCFRIEPGWVHWSEGQATRVLAISTPPWKPEDYILCED